MFVCTCVEGPAEPSPVSHFTFLIPNSGFAFGFPQRKVCIKCPQTCVPVPSFPFCHAPLHSSQPQVSSLGSPIAQSPSTEGLGREEAFLIGVVVVVVVGDFIKMFALRFCLFVCLSMCRFACLFVCLPDCVLCRKFNGPNNNNINNYNNKIERESNRNESHGSEWERGMANGSHA